MKDFLEEFDIIIFDAVLAVLFGSCLLINDSVFHIFLRILEFFIVFIIIAIVVVKFIGKMKENKKEKIQEIKLTVEKTEEKTPIIKHHYPTITKLMDEIENKIQKGYTFSTISMDKWNTVYKKEILDCIDSDYQMSQENQQKIEKILETLKTDLENTEEKREELQREISIETLENLLKMDGIKNMF